MFEAHRCPKLSIPPHTRELIKKVESKILSFRTSSSVKIRNAGLALACFLRNMQCVQTKILLFK